MTEEVMMIPVQEFKRLTDYYKGQLTESALLNKAGRLAAERHLILKDKTIPDSMAVKMIKPLSIEQGRLVKRVRTGTAGPTVYKSTEEPERMADGPVENIEKSNQRTSRNQERTHHPNQAGTCHTYLKT